MKIPVVNPPASPETFQVLAARNPAGRSVDARSGCLPRGATATAHAIFPLIEPPQPNGMEDQRFPVMATLNFQNSNANPGNGGPPAFHPLIPQNNPINSFPPNPQHSPPNPNWEMGPGLNWEMGPGLNGNPINE